MEWDQKKIEELAQVITQYDLSEIEIQSGESRIKLKKLPTPIPMIQNSPSLPVGEKQQGFISDFKHITTAKTKMDEQARESSSTPLREEKTISAVSNEEYVTSPMAGIFYRQSQPGNPPYVEVGQTVKKGETICLVEAMKMINEIAANRDGVVKEFLIENEQFVEYGTPLVLIEGE